MARLYVVNCTGQEMVVNYRLDYTVDDMGRRTSEKLIPYRSLKIPARRQIPFGGDWHAPQIQEIVSTLERTCGGVHIDMVKTAKRMGRVRLIWRQDLAIPESICRDVFAHNNRFLSEQGEERRRNLAVLADVQLMQNIDRVPLKLGVEFEQVEEDEDMPGRLEQGFTVKHPDGAGPSGKRPGRASRARSAA